ncbi:MAG: mechanosensitive ion channel [Saprospiraceae bacterium]|nr:mechanosensitive ion channel [Saprospiraceae bacterium]
MTLCFKSLKPNDSKRFITRLTIGLFLFGTSFSLHSQIDTSEVNQTPYGVIYNHLYYLQEDTYQPERASISFPENLDNSVELSKQLKKILDGKGYYVDINRLPDVANFRDSLTGEEVYFINRDEPRIYLEKIEDRWFYSRSTISQIPVMFQEVFPFGTGFFQNLHGPIWEYQILGISIAKWLGLFLLLIGCFLIFYVVNLFTRWIVGGPLKKRLGLPDTVDKYIRKVARLISLLFATRIFLFFIPVFQMPIRTNVLLLKFVGVFSLFLIILIIVQIANIGFQYLEYIVKKTENTLDDQLMPVLSRITNIIIWSIGLIYILEFLDINVTALLAGISIGGLAIALAAKDTVKNFFGSIMIFLDRPFQIGDWIHFDDIDGTVEEVGVRSTRIRTFANSIVYVPNGLLADKVVDNMGLRQYRRFKTDLEITYDTPPTTIDHFVNGLREIINKHPSTKKDNFEVHLNSFGKSSINILVYFFFEANDWKEELKGRHQIMYAMLLLAEDLRVSFAFPSQSVYVESMPAEPVIRVTAAEKQLSSSLDRIDEYFKEKHGPKSIQ